MRNLVRTAAVAAAAVALGGGAAFALEVGDKAPELEVSDWAQGPAVKLADGAGKSVYLVEFWRTFEGDCADAIPVLNGLADKYRAKGLEVIAVSTEPVDDVKKFLADHKASFRVAIDQFHNAQAAWGEVRRFPFAWLVDKTGTVVWEGDPTRGLERVLDSVVAGKYDYRREVEKEKRRREMNEAMWGGDFERLAELAEKVLEVDPGDAEALNFRMMAFQMKQDGDGFRKFMKSHVDRCKDDAKALAHAAVQAVTSGPWDWRDPDLALGAARRAVEISKGADADILSSYASVLYTIGALDQAVEQQKKAVALDDKDEDGKKALAYYVACLEARKKVAAPTSAPPKKK